MKSYAALPNFEKLVGSPFAKKFFEDFFDGVDFTELIESKLDLFVFAVYWEIFKQFLDYGGDFLEGLEVLL